MAATGNKAPYRAMYFIAPTSVTYNTRRRPDACKVSVLLVKWFVSVHFGTCPKGLLGVSFLLLFLARCLDVIWPYSMETFPSLWPHVSKLPQKMAAFSSTTNKIGSKANLSFDALSPVYVPDQFRFVLT